jgi:hypothetical protein
MAEVGGARRMGRGVERRARRRRRGIHEGDTKWIPRIGTLEVRRLRRVERVDGEWGVVGKVDEEEPWLHCVIVIESNLTHRCQIDQIPRMYQVPDCAGIIFALSSGTLTLPSLRLT